MTVRPELLFLVHEGVWRKNIGVGQLNGPAGLSIDYKTGNIVVIENGSHAVRIFDKFGKSIRVFGTQGQAEDVSATRGLTLDIEGTIIVADRWNSRLQIFSPKGEFLRKLDRLPQGPRTCVVNKEGDLIFATADKIFIWR